MRRKDREITEESRIREIILACDCCRLGFAQEDGVYIVPLNFGFSATPEKRSLYFHCAGEGKKLELMAANPKVGFEMDTHHAVNSGDRACDYSFRFQSVIGKGQLCRVEALTEKKEALRCLMEHISGKENWAFTDAEANSVTILRLDVLELSCKEHL
ncbi:MAG TPA: pyridoxamine 5'-phosphate oxidase family protein [Candidatus Limiplasma sp.]|nr:pyridoxamine 5'-phosphate oxidase family protein [Candidatus Limiplasma sp.]HPS82141.1 pyridoxamine 5'-phosphate oxidase family protein [Candidatus Limiplasma sp.]